MKIYTVGSASTGKTSLAKYISEKYNLPLITEAARQILAEREWSIDSLRADLQKVNQYQREVFYRQLQEEKKYEGQNFISDRGFDFLCYTLQFSRIGPEILATKEWQEYLESLKKDNVLILFIRPHKSLVKKDGVRENLSWKASVAIDAMTKMLLQMFSLKYFQIDCVSMQERTNLADNIIDLFLAKEEKKKEAIKINGIDLGMAQEEYNQEKEKLQKELRERENSGFIKFGKENEIVYFSDNPNDYEIKQINIPETKYESVYSTQALLGYKMNYSSFVGGEEILVEEQQAKPHLFFQNKFRGIKISEAAKDTFDFGLTTQKYKGEF
jgi:nicotinamide riboside kinase